MTIDAKDFQFVRELVLARSAIVLEAGKEYLIEARLGPIARELKLDGIAGLVEALRRSPSTAPLTTRVVEAMTTNETSFFRDSHPFDSLKNAIIPKVLERNTDKTLNIWSAACSTGQEPYTIAMTLKENFPQLEGWKVNILATDLSEQVLARARSGCYRQMEVNRGLPAAYMTKYFVRRGMDWEVVPELKKWIDFRPLNLIGDWGTMPRFDVVFLRNVLIYFDLETKRRILARVRRTMKPEAWLFLGGAETTMNVDESFRRVVVERSHAYQNAA